jgi:hypothetical protein
MAIERTTLGYPGQTHELSGVAYPANGLMPDATIAKPAVLLDKDPWKHRSQGMSCSTCMWFVRKVSEEPQADKKPLGRCRRHAPTMNGYPVVFMTDWCGDHKLDENKL